MSFVNLNITIIHSTSRTRSSPSSSLSFFLSCLVVLHRETRTHSCPLSSSRSSGPLLLFSVFPSRILNDVRVSPLVSSAPRGVSFLFCFQRPLRMPPRERHLKFQISFNRIGSSVPGVSFASSMQLNSC